MDTESVLFPNETRALRIAVGFMTAGEADGVHQRDVDAANSAWSKLDEAPRQSAWLPFSKGELRVIWAALTNGAEGVLQPSSGFSAKQRDAFRAAANRIADAGGLGPRF